jgi:hypothetical protein
VAEVRTNKGQIHFLGLDVLDHAKPFNGSPVQQITPNSVYGIRGVNDNASIFKDVRGEADLARFRINWMYF